MVGYSRPVSARLELAELQSHLHSLPDHPDWIPYRTTSYADAWTRSQRVIRDEILPLAAELQVVVGIEEVWNKFLLSPPELARYVARDQPLDTVDHLEGEPGV